jgi:hypothetical protein
MLTPAQLYRNATMSRVHVEPVTPGTEGDGWMVINQTTWQGVGRDARRYGWRTALYNLAACLGFVHVPSSAEKSDPQA